MPPPLVLTARLDASTADRLDALRRRHFPPERNHLRAHLTLFHRLPGEEEAAVVSALEARAARTPPLPCMVAGVRRLGQGVAYELAAPGLVALREELAAGWRPWLTRQDDQPLRPHVTVQNKVPPAQAARLHAELTAAFVPWEAVVDAIEVWRYEGAPWAPVRRVPLAG